MVVKPGVGEQVGVAQTAPPEVAVSLLELVEWACLSGGRSGRSSSPGLAGGMGSGLGTQLGKPALLEWALGPRKS